MTLTIRPVTKKNWKAIAELQTKPGQAPYIEPNAISMLESFFDKELKWKCYGLYQDDVPVGFMMAGAMSRFKRYIWLDRFMIDAAFQGQGLGPCFLDEVVAFLADEFPVKTIKTSIIDGNQFMKRLYIEAGFIETGEIDEEFNEEVLIRKV